MRRALPVVLALVVGVAVGWMARGERVKGGAAGAPAPGTVLTISRPTGEVVTGAEGAHPRPRLERTRLRVYRVQGGDTYTAPPGGVMPWQVQLGEPPNDTTFYAVPD